MYIFLESLESPNFDFRKCELNWRNCRTDVLFGKPMEGNVKPGIGKWRCLHCMCEGFKRFCISLFSSVLILAPVPARDQWPVELHLMSKFKSLNSLWFEEIFLKLSSSINYIFIMEDMNSSLVLNGITQVWYYFFQKCLLYKILCKPPWFVLSFWCYLLKKSQSEKHRFKDGWNHPDSAD